ncbi:RNA methyltransferase [Fervidicella metallireducens AeB]|uniref:RNA methyltransferase n=1 Tax=Fervidicella metallireducens AeB TaxID=1403537 RepID=A0A017RYS9_9CLOT|nr:hypothetical protein [Fervidicella metallireducens]EYE89065.1 RNA methyltransferase [Fervidicella metallireducens AeB]
MYLYYINYKNEEKSLCHLEMKSLFGVVPNDKYFITDKYINENRSPFIKYMLKILDYSNNLEELVNKVKLRELKIESYKVKFLDIEKDIDFENKHKIEGIIGYEIIGDVDMYNPRVIYGITKIDGVWYFGEYSKNNKPWIEHSLRPCQYSNSLSTTLARTVVNIAVGDNYNWKIIDPCCGIGTVLIEALSMGLNIVGSDINPKVVEGSNRNLRFFELPEVASLKDINEIEENYDVCIIDIPYGLLSRTSKEEQQKILNSARRISKRLVLLSLDDMTAEIENAGFKIIEKCEAYKKNFKRYLTLCV